MVAGMKIGAPPRDVYLDFGERGKPFVAGAGENWGINISHSGDWVLCAAGPCEAIGVDVEAMTPVDVQALASSAFSRWERAVLARCRKEEHNKLFFKIWSMKEAVIKADGAGVAFGLDRFDVEFRPGYPSAVRRVDGDSASRWHIRTCMLDPSHAAAVAWRHARRFDVRWYRHLPGARRNATGTWVLEKSQAVEIGTAC
jgi:4'-phosphopantetheinyl transferase